ncbi:MAG: cytosine permease, partial [Salinibacterium sp.]|nr:cytosine permease [Salinibacterium sp.]
MAHDGEALDPTSSRPASPAGTASGPPSSLAARQGGAASDGEIHDDDALADALAAEYTWMATAAIPIVSSPETQADVPLFIEPHVLEQEDSSSQDFAPLDFGAAPADASAPADEPAASDAAPPAWDPGEIINAAPVWEPPASTEPESAVRGEEESPADSAPVEKHDAPVERRDEPDVVQAAPLWDEPAGTVDPGLPSFVSPFDSPALPEVSSDEELTPWSSLPAPDPTHAVQHPDAPPQFLAATPIADWPAPSFDEPVAAEFERAAESERPGPNAWTAWAPVAAAPSEWDAAASVSPPVAPDEAAAVQPSFPVEPEVEVEPESLDAPAPEFDPTPEPEAEAQSEPEPEQFPWIAAAAAAAAAPPLVQPVESDPFNWSITATGKVAYLDEPVSPTVEPAEPASTEPASTEADDPPPRMFSPPPLVEPLAAPQPTPAAGLPFAPPTYLPVGEPERGPSDREEPLGFPDADPVDPAQAAPQSMFIEPTPLDSLSAALPTGVGSSVPTATGSISIIDQAYEEELEDDVDDTDRASAALVGGTGGTTVVAPPTSTLPPSGPISTVRIAEDESVLYSDEPSNQRVFSLEKSGVEPTPVERRAGRAARLFWLWFAANSSIISVALGAVVFAAGMSLRQSVVAILAGVALSFIPLGLTTLAGKRSGQPTMVVSRATFGLLGNILPALLALVSRVFWGAVLLWVLATSVSSILVGAGASGGLTEDLLVYLCLAGGLVVALLIASMGYPLLARIQLIVTIVASILIVGLIVLTAQFIDV